MKSPAARPSTYKIYVGNLPHATTEADLRDLFAAAGRVRSVEIVRHQETNYPCGFGFVGMSTAAEAFEAVARFNDYVLGVKRLAVNLKTVAKAGHEPHLALVVSRDRASTGRRSSRMSKSQVPPLTNGRKPASD